MIKNETVFPNRQSDLFLTDGGLETTLVFLHGIDLPNFAAFPLLNDSRGYATISEYYINYLEIAKKYKTSFILESPTWRSNPNWLKKMGYEDSALTTINAKAIQLMNELKATYIDSIPSILISGCIGPEGDGYKPDHRMSVKEARDYHSKQVGIFKNLSIDMVSAITMNYVEEALGITLAANDADLPVVISFTVETNGKLVTGTSLKEAIEEVDAKAMNAPLYYMINCSHPSHFMNELETGDKTWLDRIGGIRSNASAKSHGELDESTELDSGDPSALAKETQQIRNLFNHINVFGGCCGTDERHIEEMARLLQTHRS